MNGNGSSSSHGRAAARQPDLHFEYAASRYFEARLPPDPFRTGLWKVLCGHLQKSIPPSSAVLELGAGYCDFINNIQAASKHAIDVSPEILRFAAEGVVTHVQPCSQLAGFADASFDVIFASNLLEHLTREDLLSTLSGALRILRPGGKLLIIQPNFRYCYKTYFDDYTHVAVFTHVSLADLLRANGFRIDRVSARYLPFSVKSRGPKWPWLLRVYLKLPWRPRAAQMYIACSKPLSSR
jgi:SAM-dependent methyltransferase